MRGKRIRTIQGWLVCIFLLAACRPAPAATPAPPILSETGALGTVTRERETVEIGKSPETLQVVGENFPLLVGDILRVTRGGQALLNFRDNLKLRLFNDTKLKLESLTESEDVPLDARIFLEDKGLTGELVPQNGRVEFTTPTGVKVAVLGTRFFIVYDPVKRLTTVGNFHGLVGVGTGVGNPVLLQSGYYLDAFENQPPGPQIPIPVADVQFEVWASDNSSSIVAVDLLRVTTPTVSPTVTVTVPLTITAEPVSTVTPIPIPSDTSTPVPPASQPLGPPVAVVIRNGECRTGPGSVFRPVVRVLFGMQLPIAGRLVDSSWWVVRLANPRVECWVWSNNVQVSGDLSGVPVVDAPPTPTGIPSVTPSPPDKSVSATETVTSTLTLTPTLDTGPPPPPVLISPVSDLDCTPSVTLTWEAVSDPSGIPRYEWQLDDVLAESSQKGEAAGTSTDVRVVCGDQAYNSNRSYVWRVRAIDGAGNSGPFAEAKFSVLPPAAPVQGPQIGSIFVRPEPACAFSDTVSVSVSVQEGDRRIAAVSLDWTTNGGAYTTQSMSWADQSQNIIYYRGTAGPASAPGVLNLLVTVVDDQQNQATARYDVKAMDCSGVKAATNTPIPTGTATSPPPIGN